MKFLYPFLFVVLVVSVAGCESENDTNPDSSSDNFPFQFVSDSFQYEGFNYPDDWDVVAVSSYVEMSDADDENEGNQAFSEEPFRYRFVFGREANTNEVSTEEIDAFNEKSTKEQKTIRQHYYHTYHEHYATLHISSDSFLKNLSDLEGVDTLEVNKHEVLVMNQQNEWVINAQINNAYYELLVKNEAVVTDKEDLKELLKIILP
ncbi:hypothetical protein CR203_22515 [Salipaludibacillus neizhouensis]|uniref:DUF4367 domain-containing protein n=1 Tax=Salipaludibacillus neizhouensis TaxID=885475 RepID=A0A3A9KCL4_9BACI|nr:hypothetical protein [Salipaludibacillus neizhouensis]RKL65125.1 hypothetical protein CR203_22515 [Salipaludibacillus neizhouensis]